MTDDPTPPTPADVLADWITELRAMHRPQWVPADRSKSGFTDDPAEAQPGKDPIGCVYCYPDDGSWPCDVAMVADEMAERHAAGFRVVRHDPNLAARLRLMIVWAKATGEAADDLLAAAALLDGQEYR